MLDVLKEEKQHQAFANQESVRVLDYQQCIQATRTGNDQAVKSTLRSHLEGDSQQQHAALIAGARHRQ